MTFPCSLSAGITNLSLPYQGCCSLSTQSWSCAHFTIFLSSVWLTSLYLYIPPTWRLLSLNKVWSFTLSLLLFSTLQEMLHYRPQWLFCGHGQKLTNTPIYIFICFNRCILSNKYFDLVPYWISTVLHASWGTISQKDENKLPLIKNTVSPDMSHYQNKWRNISFSLYYIGITLELMVL